MSRPTTSSFPPHENNERDDSDDVYSEEDLGMTMKTMELRAAKRTKEGGNITTTTDDDAIDFDRTLALGKLLEIYIILFLTHFLYYTHQKQDLPDGCSYTTSG